MAPSQPPVPSSPPAAGDRPRYRDRHGHGLRGPLVPPEVPLSRSRGQRFDDAVLEAVEHLEERWAEQLTGVEFAVEDVPVVPAAPAGAPAAAGSAQESAVPLGRIAAGSGREPARVIVYRRPIEARAADLEALHALVHDVVVEQVALLLGLDPDVLDPPYT